MEKLHTASKRILAVTAQRESDRLEMERQQHYTELRTKRRQRGKGNGAGSEKADWKTRRDRSDIVGNPVDRLVFILEEMYGNDLDKVIADMKKNGRSETGRHINGTLSSPTNNKTSGSSSSSTTSTTSTNNRTSSSDEKGSGGSSQRNTIYTNQDNSVESQLWDRYFLAESEGDVQKSAAVLSQWSARYIDICRHSRRENLPAATLIESSSTGSGCRSSCFYSRRNVW